MWRHFKDKLQSKGAIPLRLSLQASHFTTQKPTQPDVLAVNIKELTTLMTKHNERSSYINQETDTETAANIKGHIRTETATSKTVHKQCNVYWLTSNLVKCVRRVRTYRGRVRTYSNDSSRRSNRCSKRGREQNRYH